MQIRPYCEGDFDRIWPFFSKIVRDGETYAFPRSMSQAQAKDRWLHQPRQTFIAKIDAAIVGTYYIKTNQAGPGDHVCNCGYMVDPVAANTGIATAMCLHSQEIALELGYKAMQFNCVVSTNERAVNLWLKLGFDTVGRLPKAFNHPTLGYVDALVMYKWLEPNCDLR